MQAAAQTSKTQEIGCVVDEVSLKPEQSGRAHEFSLVPVRSCTGAISRRPNLRNRPIAPVFSPGSAALESSGSSKP